MTQTQISAVILLLASYSIVVGDDTTHAQPTLRPDETLRPKIEASLRVNYILRDTRDTTLVQTMIQVDNPPTDMAFEMSLRSAHDTWPLGPVAWSTGDAHWWAYDTDLPQGLATVDVVLTPSALAAVKVKRQPRHYPPNLNEVWSGSAIVLPGVKIRQQRISMHRIPPPGKPAALEYALEQLGEANAVVRQLKLNGDLSVAIAELRRTVDDTPQDVLALYRLGCLELADGNIVAAMGSFVETRRNKPAQSQQRMIQRQLRRICAICLYIAEKDDVAAMCVLGQAYELGWGVNQDYQEARHWLRNAANVGHAESMRRLAAMYQNELGATVHTEQAHRWYQAQANVWFQRAADLGDEEARQWLSTQNLR